MRRWLLPCYRLVHIVDEPKQLEIPNLHSTAFWIILLISTRAKLAMSLHPSMYLVFNHKPFTFWRVTLIVLLYNIRFFQLILLHRSETSCVHHHLQKYLEVDTMFHITPCIKFVVDESMGDAGLTVRKIIYGSQGILQ